MGDLLSGFQSDEFVPAEYDASFAERQEMAAAGEQPREVLEISWGDFLRGMDQAAAEAVDEYV